MGKYFNRSSARPGPVSLAAGFVSTAQPTRLKGWVMGEIRADFQAVADAEQKFSEALRRLEGLREGLGQALERTLSGWNGDAREAYLIAHARWNRSARRCMLS
ncbi:WXG100 family type VII secretion target [Actinomadura oligospora]|uniref:WXG100 family type VII secretion target n=1 Tax=Actinomadura oligospora TaxID=111804 RepID=UPI000A00A696